jgi:aspartate aminotransferase
MFSDKIVQNLSKSSWIRAMFEEGEKLRKIYGADKVYDFSLGNPDSEPPLAVLNSIAKHAGVVSNGIHKYMPNAGYNDVREKIAFYVNEETGVNFTASNIVMTCGAAGGLNTVLKAILNPSDEVIVLAPFFVEYLSYIDNHGGIGVVVPPNPPAFQPNATILEKYITPKTKAIIINSPNNPTGVVYNEASLEAINEVISKKEKEFGIQIYIISDEPYTRIVYDGVKVSSIPVIFKNAIIVNSYSKSLALPGERIGYVAASPNIEGIELLISAITYCNRVLGYVNAPSLFQKVVADTHNESVDVDSYKARRDKLYGNLIKLGFECVKPDGAFYLFVKSPIPDDIVFKNVAMKYNILVVPGTGFGCSGYFRLAYCVNMSVIDNSLPAFKKLAKGFFN